MKISEFKCERYEILGEDKEIKSLTFNSKNECESGLYFCINGTQVDGHKFAIDAVKKGAVAVICERKLDLLEEVTQIIVPSSRRAMGLIASQFYGEPQNSMKIIMVTGTNGKTSTTYILKKVLEDAGNKVGVIGTNGSFIGEEHINSKLTTPDPIELFELLSKMKNSGCSVVCMEASAHALALDKLAGLKADIAILTNITQDHLDFFGDMDNYAKAKFKLFTPEMCKACVINTDDKYGAKLYQNLQIPALSFGINKNADIIARDITQNKNGQSFNAKIGENIFEEHLQLDGRFNAINTLGVIAVCELLGLDQTKVAKSLSKLPPVEGRFNKFHINGVDVVIDYAHTPDGIANILSACRELAENGKVIAVFGCGGNRDAAKRPIMGEVACSLADFAVITSDNPRYEDPEDIIEDIKTGLVGFDNYRTITDRKSAIIQAIGMAQKGDVVAILGKGNENYLEVCGEKLPYSDKDVVEMIKE